MKPHTISLKLAAGLPLALVTAFSAAAVAQQRPAAEGVPVRITVTAASRAKGQEPPALSKSDILIYENHDRRPVLEAVRQTGANNKLDLYIVVDDSVTSDVTLDYTDVKSFVRELPTAARVGVAYALNGTITVAQDLTSDREAAMKSLRIPLGRFGAGGGIYLSLADMAKRLPPDLDRRRAILFLSSGIDLYRGIDETYPGRNVDLGTAIDRLDRSGITVYPIYVSPAAHFLRNLFLINNGQSCLSRLADETGGEAYFQGFQTPVSMKPFLEEMARHLDNQYMVTFAAKARSKSGYAYIRVATELSGVDITGPDRIYVPAEK
ncbi:MAG TPA: hypothetical protein VLW54_13125 [Candidatus Acidoferrales bacterium]|nr:hypothetical protein [Candidatus Acidoferrales bacterium]